MAIKKKKKSSGGVPEWVVTFGDMMSLLLCFFILLQMFSELKREHEYQRVVTAIKEAFGYAGGIGVLPVDDPPLKSMVETLESLAVKKDENESRISRNQDPGLDGPHARVTKIRDGIVFTIGGPSMFEPYSAEVNDRMREEIGRIASLMKGRNNKIEIVGHAAAKYLPPESPWKDLDELSYQRAINVKNMLLDFGLNDRVFRIKAVGKREPLRPRAVDAEAAAENRRVEIILTEQLVEELNADADFTDVSAARGG